MGERKGMVGGLEEIEMKEGREEEGMKILEGLEYK